MTLYSGKYAGSNYSPMNEPPENGTGADDEAANELVTPAMCLLELEAQHRALDGKIAELHG